MGTASHDVNRQRAEQLFNRDLRVPDNATNLPRDETDDFGPAEIEAPEIEAPEYRPQPREVAGIPVTILTTDMELCAAIRAAVMDDHPLCIAPHLEDAAKFAATGRCPILITDQALDPSELARLTAPLRAHDPALVIIAVGNRGEDGELKDLVSARVVDRFLLKPVTPALTRLMIESVAREYRWRNAHALIDAATTGPAPTAAQRKDQRKDERKDQKTPGQPPTGRPESPAATEQSPPAQQGSAEPATLADAAPRGAIVTVAPAFDLESSQRPQTTSVLTHAERRPPSIPRPPWTVVVAVAAAVAAAVWWIMFQRLPDIDPREVITTNLAAAQQALDAGRYIDPPEHSALHHYSAVLALDPANVQAKDGIDKIADRFVDDAGTLIARERFADAVVALASARRVRPDHQQLPTLEAQLRTRLEAQLLQARELSDAPDTQQRDQTAGGSAEVRVASRARPDNVAARRSSRETHSRILVEANETIARGQFDAARRLITEAEKLGVPVTEIAALNAALILALEASQKARAKDALLQLVLRRTAENQLIEPAQDSAKHYLDQLAQTDRQFPGLRQGIDVLGTRLVANAEAAITQKDFDLAARLISQARDIGFTKAEVGTAETALRAARTAPVAPLEIAPPAAPRLIKLVQPQYPDEARLRGIEGWVDLSLGVTAAGDVINPRVENSSMSHLFGRAALAAVKKWKYEPRATADPDRRLQVRVQFKLEN